MNEEEKKVLRKGGRTSKNTLTYTEYIKQKSCRFLGSGLMMFCLLLLLKGEKRGQGGGGTKLSKPFVACRQRNDVKDNNKGKNKQKKNKFGKKVGSTRTLLTLRLHTKKREVKEKHTNERSVRDLD